MKRVTSIKNIPVCVVGGAGFLGSHLVYHLIEDRGCKVLVIDNLVAGRREFIHPKAVFYHHDICGSEEHLRQLFNDVDFVFNYAAYPYIPDSFARPLHVCNVNFFGAMKVINAAFEAGCKGVLQVSSAEIYGGPDYGKHEPHQGEGCAAVDAKIDEDYPVVPHSSYGVAKAAIDNWIQCRWKEAKTPCIALRQFNCIGERETHPYVIPEIISQLAAQSIPVSGKGETHLEGRGREATVKLGNNSFRDFMYAGDAVRIAVELLERGEFGEVYNLGSESGVKIYDLAKMIGKLMGFADVRVEEDEARKRPWEIWHLQSDNEKIRRAIGAPSQNLVGLLSLESALKRTIADFEASGRKWCWEK